MQDTYQHVLYFSECFTRAVGTQLTLAQLVYSAVKVDISEWYPFYQLLMIRVLGLTEAVLCVLIVSTMHAIIKTYNALIKKKKRTEKQRATM